MDLIDDENLVFTLLGRHIYLLDKVADVIDTVVGCGVEFNKVERVASGYCHAGIAFAASLAVGCRRQTVDCAGEYAGAGSLAYAARSAE